MRRSLLFFFLALPIIARGADEPAPDVLADFENGIPKIFRAEGLTPALTNEGAPQGKSALKLEPVRAGGAMRCFISCDNPVDCIALKAWIKVEAEAAHVPPVLRWYALDSNGKPLFQHRIEVKAGDWQQITEPLAQWPWARGRVGDWASVRSFALTIEGRVKSVWLDEISAPRPNPLCALPSLPWIKEIGFENRTVREVRDDDIWLATDMLDAFTQDDMQALLKKILAARAWLKRTFGTAFHTADPGRPISVLIFSSKEAQVKLFERLGKAWHLQIAPSNAGGYTVLDIATIPPAAGKLRAGTDRPVYLHEAVHALVGRDLRIVSGGELTNWFQEGLANYVQLCVNPESLDRAVYVKNFARAIDADGKSFFKPMKMLLTTPAKTEHYAQLASVVAFLSERHREWLQGIATGLANGDSIETILPKIGTDFEAVEKEWLEWGRAAFANEKGESGGIFSVPEEFKALK